MARPAPTTYQPDPAGDCTQCGRHGTATHPEGQCLPLRVLSLDEAVTEALGRVELAVRDIRADHPGINDANAYHTAATGVCDDLPAPVAAEVRRRLGLGGAR